MAKNSAASLLTSVDSLFTTQEERDIATQPRVQEIPVDKIDDFPNHPFKVRMDDNMIEMAESVKQHGILVPAIVRPKENGYYEMVAGHRRKLACTLIAKLQLPCIVRELTDEEATLIMVDSNLQREQLLPSEKAFAYKMKLDAMRRQAGRPRNSAPMEPNILGTRSNEELAAQSPDSRSQIQRYIRLTALIPEMLDLVDNSVLKDKEKLQIAIRPAVELSYLTQQEQHDLYETMVTEDCTPSHVQAMKMRKFSEEGRLNMDVIFSIMQEEKPNHTDASVATLYTCDSANPQKVTITAGATATVNFHNRLNTGGVKLVKETNTGKNLDGWQIGLYADAACTKPVSGSPFTTGADGSITVSDLSVGTLYAKEIEVDDPYWVCDTSVKTVNITAGQTATVTFRNTHYGDMRIRKNAVNGSADGWSFQIMDSERNLVTTIKTGADGYAHSGRLLPGQYFILEVHDRDDTYWEYDPVAEKQVTITAGSLAEVVYTNT